jgi:hypothetical protein
MHDTLWRQMPRSGKEMPPGVIILVIVNDVVSALIENFTESFDERRHFPARVLEIEKFRAKLSRPVVEVRGAPARQTDVDRDMRLTGRSVRREVLEQRHHPYFGTAKPKRGKYEEDPQLPLGAHSITIVP